MLAQAEKTRCMALLSYQRKYHGCETCLDVVTGKYTHKHHLGYILLKSNFPAMPFELLLKKIVRYNKKIGH